jgi:hypothetical protein
MCTHLFHVAARVGNDAAVAAAAASLGAKTVRLDVPRTRSKKILAVAAVDCRSPVSTAPPRVRRDIAGHRRIGKALTNRQKGGP